MVRSKKVAAAVIAGVLTLALGVGTALAADKADTNGMDDIKAKLAQQEPAKQDKTYTHGDLVKFAGEACVDIAGMTDVQIEDALRAAKLARAAEMGEPAKPGRSLDELTKKAQAVGVDPTGLSEEQLIRAIKEAGAKLDPKAEQPLTHDDLVNIATKMGLDIAGMTDGQIEDALRAQKTSENR